MADRAKEKHYDRNIFISNLNRYLSINDLTQKEVANAIDISTSSFCDYAKGRSFPGIDILKSLADYFGIKIADLIEKETIPQNNNSKEEQEVLDLYYSLSKENRVLFKKIIKSINSEENQ